MEEVSDRATGEVHIHRYDEGEITRESDCLRKTVQEGFLFEHGYIARCSERM